MEKVEREVKVTKYIAFDGTEFDNELQCSNYEFSEVGKLLSELNCFGYVTDDDDVLISFGAKYYILMPRTRHDIFVLGRILEICGMENNVTADLLYKPIMLKVNMNNIGIGRRAEITQLDKWMTSISGGKFTVVSLIKDEKVKQDKK